ncbi:MAG: hypothetical protein RL721_1082 [Candidatus Eisenbacteria bacterium]
MRFASRTLRFTSTVSVMVALATRSSHSVGTGPRTRSVLSIGAGRNTMSKLGWLSARMRP